MHTKLKGSIGEAKVAADLMTKGYSVFTELGDLSPIDLIAEKDGELLRIQVKWSKVRNGVAVLPLRRCMSNKNLLYIKQYTMAEVDIFAVYIDGLDVVAYVPWSKLGDLRNRFSIRCEPAKNGQRGNPLSEFLSIPI